jgi:hypothetical protein
MSHAQQPPQPSASAVFAGQLATMIVTTAEERDALARQLAAAQQQVAALEAAAKAPDSPAPETKARK